MNKTEEAFKSKAIEAGWIVTKGGWPDFLCLKGGMVVLVEVKPDNGQTELKRTQRFIMACLSNFGVPCFRWSPSRGFKRVNGSHNQVLKQLSLLHAKTRRERMEFRRKIVTQIGSNGVTANNIDGLFSVHPWMMEKDGG